MLILTSKLTFAKWGYQAVREGGRPEWEAISRIAAKPKNPFQGVSAMRAMGASKDLKLADETFEFILNEARDQDTFYYAGGLQRNYLTRKFVAQKFKEHFATVRICFFDVGSRLRWLTCFGFVVPEALLWQLWAYPMD